MMEYQQFRNKLPSLLPTVPNYASEDEKRNLKEGVVLVANKTGELLGLQHDVGIFVSVKSCAMPNRVGEIFSPLSHHQYVPFGIRRFSLCPFFD